ncbi:MAG: DUF4442 domain-containing protein [Pseudomonadota bacterium]
MASFYQTLTSVGQRIVPRHVLFKYAFNFSPMYRRTTARITSMSEDLHRASIRLPISWRNRNYVGSIFGGSLYSAADPLFMVQLINILDSEYVVWDKAGEIRFKAPAREDLVADFVYTPEEVAAIRAAADERGEHVFEKTVHLTDVRGERTYCEVSKTLYVATKAFYKEKQARRRRRAPSSG